MSHPTVFCKVLEEDLQRYNTIPYLGRTEHTTQNTDPPFLLAACRAEPWGNGEQERENGKSSGIFSKDGDLVNASVLLRTILDIGCCEGREWYLQTEEISTLLPTRENMARSFSCLLPQRGRVTYVTGVFRRRPRTCSASAFLERNASWCTPHHGLSLQVQTLPSIGKAWRKKFNSGVSNRMSIITTHLKLFSSVGNITSFISICLLLMFQCLTNIGGDKKGYLWEP